MSLMFQVKHCPSLQNCPKAIHRLHTAHGVINVTGEKQFPVQISSIYLSAMCNISSSPPRTVKSSSSSFKILWYLFLKRLRDDSFMRYLFSHFLRFTNACIFYRHPFPLGRVVQRHKPISMRFFRASKKSNRQEYDEGEKRSEKVVGCSPALQEQHQQWRMFL